KQQLQIRLWRQTTSPPNIRWPNPHLHNQTDLTSSKIASLEAKFSKRLSHFSPTTEGFSKDGAALQQLNSQSSNPPSSKNRNRYSTMSQFIGNGDSECEE
ncbi:uncharacterized protein VP01_15444g1, partial [Puccinia sorghi]